ncbi:MAG: hypothetical protein J2P35_21440 [Actinobacteria bacterium]|nr:hypothetical protein [Actinomycetota bacterium]
MRGLAAAWCLAAGWFGGSREVGVREVGLGEVGLRQVGCCRAARVRRAVRPDPPIRLCRAVGLPAALRQWPVRL